MTLIDSRLKIFKFRIRHGDFRKIVNVVTNDKGEREEVEIEISGYLTAVIAPTEERAREHAVRFAAENGISSRWLEVADVIEIPIIDGAVMGWSG